MTDHNAHAWVEAWFPGYGWLPFDPTPGRGSLAASYSASSTGFNAGDAADGFVGEGSRGVTGGGLAQLELLEQKERLAEEGGAAAGRDDGAGARSGFSSCWSSQRSARSARSSSCGGGFAT